MDGISRKLLTDEVFRPHPGSGLPESPSLGPTSEPFERTLSGTAEVLIYFVLQWFQIFLGQDHLDGEHQDG